MGRGLTGLLSQGHWKNKFDKDSVYVSEFHSSQTRSCSVNMMYQEARFRYKHFPEDQVQLLEMPYRGDDITMVIVLPSQGTALSQVRGGRGRLNQFDQRCGLY